MDKNEFLELRMIMLIIRRMVIFKLKSMILIHMF